MTLGFHVTAGIVGLGLATVALAAAKGGRLHRRSGLLFVYAMLGMAVSGVALALANGPDANALGGVTAAYLVVTALITVRPRSPRVRQVEVGAMMYGLAFGLVSFVLAFVSMTLPGAHIDGVPAPILFTFAAVGLLGGVGDLRMIRSDGLRGTQRLSRHLWRMCFALWIATASFFLGQSDELPEALRILPLLAALAFAPLVVLVYWLWRVRRSSRGITVAEDHESLPSLNQG